MQILIPYMQRYGTLLQKGSSSNSAESQELQQISKQVIESIEAVSRVT